MEQRTLSNWKQMLEQQVLVKQCNRQIRNQFLCRPMRLRFVLCLERSYLNTECIVTIVDILYDAYHPVS